VFSGRADDQFEEISQEEFTVSIAGGCSSEVN
jgi:hypothetical protein